MEYYDESMDDMREYYRDNFSLRCVSADIGTKFALISLICFLTKQARIKTPNVTPLQVIQKIRSGKEGNNSDKLIKGLAVMCEDFMLNTTDFLTFNMKTSKEMVAKINEVLDKELPWDNGITDNLPF